MIKYLLVATNFLAIFIALCLFVNENRIIKMVDRRILEQTEKSYFIGCGSATGAFEYCHILAKQYRYDMAKDLGLSDEL